jgi:hypothetical protein
MVDKDCIHYEVCGYSRAAFETCEKCEFRKHRIIDTNRQILDVERFMEELENIGTDMCEYYELSKDKPIRGYSQEVIQEAIEACHGHTEDVVGVCIEHPWAEEENGLLISEFECPFCHAWHKESAVDKYCTQCGNPIMIVHNKR